MNVVYLHCHDAGRFISAYGHKLPTPHLEKFAREGTLFRQAHCAGPTCSPSRAALLLGQSPHETGMYGLAHRGFSLAAPERHLAAYLRRNGFHTCLSGVQHEFSWQAEKPYETVLSLVDTSKVTEQGLYFQVTDRMAAVRSAQFIKGAHERPFFLSCGFILPHREFPYEFVPGYEPDRVTPPAGIPDTPQTRKDYAHYCAAVKNMDDCAGVVLEALRESGRDRDTIVIFTTDHGIAFPLHKCNLTDRGTGVSLIMSYPDNPSSGKASDALVSHVDIYPTLCDLLGLEAPEWLRGTSLRPLFEGKANEVREELYSEVSYHADYQAERAIRTQRYKLIKCYDTDRRVPPANCDDSPSKDAVFKDAGLLAKERPTYQLYDLLTDPQEFNNVAGDATYRAILKEMETRLEKWMATTNDPLLKGPIARPEGARVNPRTHYSPGMKPE